MEGRGEADKPLLAVLLQGVTKGSLEGLSCPHNLQQHWAGRGRAVAMTTVARWWAYNSIPQFVAGRPHLHCRESASLSWDAQWSQAVEGEVKVRVYIYTHMAYVGPTLICICIHGDALTV